jgi:molybdate/tungstate transport system substrate-binding protein
VALLASRFGHEIRHMHRGTIAGLLLLAASCADHVVAPDTLVVYEAASLAGPMRAALDTFARRTGAVVLEEHGASLELARRVTELHRIPDVIALADHEVFSEQLRPPVTWWYAAFARNRMVVAYTRRSRYASEVTADNWRSILLRPDVLLGRTDPVLAPAGYRALLVFRLAESHYRDGGLAKRLEARTPPTLLRGNAAELAALLSAGELDYIIEYESLARAQHFEFITLPADIDLGDATRAATYATASVRVGNGRDSITRRGSPILYGVSVPRGAPHGVMGVRFLEFLLGTEGQAMLRAAHVDALEHPKFFGDSVPPVLRSLGAP